jgi:predicted cation transporter
MAIVFLRFAYCAFHLCSLRDGLLYLFHGGIFKYFIQVPSQVLYWVNITSAILDNATLTAAEIGPALSQQQISAALMGLLIFGGCLIPGNIPNIISAGKLGITSSEYAKLGVPFGIVMGAFSFVLVFYVGFMPTIGLGT